MSTDEPAGAVLSEPTAMNTRAETELIRFRVDATLKARAEAACHRRGLDLHDVLRTFVTRIAIEDAIPFDLNAPVRAVPKAIPFAEYGPYLEQDLAHLNAERVLSLLATFIADRGKRLADEKDKPQANAKRIARWTRELREAVGYHRTLDTCDQALVEQVGAKFRALLAEQA